MSGACRATPCGLEAESTEFRPEAPTWLQAILSRVLESSSSRSW